MRSLAESSPDSTCKGGCSESSVAEIRSTRPYEVAKAAPAHHHFWVRLFAQFVVLFGDRALPLPQDKRALSILKYLCAHQGKPVSQDFLRGWLWPESSPEKARLSLNSAIYSLRQFLSREWPATVSSSYVLLGAGHYQLSPEIQVSLDVEDFDTHYEHGRYFEKRLQLNESLAEYEKALALYQGDYLAEDLHEGTVDWTTIERERLTEAYMDILSRLARYYMDTGQLRESIVTCYQLLEKDCCHEDSYRLLMRCYARLGLQVRTIHHYKLCRDTLMHKYGMDASSETEALYKSFLRGESI